ncbi:MULTISPECIES: hypothetical protein [unclassified Bartonella]
MKSKLFGNKPTPSTQASQQDTPTCTPTGLQHAPHPHRHPPHPPFPFLLPPFPQGTTSHALGKQTPTQPFQKNSMKSKLFGNKPTPSTQTPQHMPQQDTPACTTPSQASAPPFLHPSSFPLPPFPQGTTSHALGKKTSTQPFQKGLSESQALWQAKRFRDYWQEKSGKEALKVNWQAP